MRDDQGNHTTDICQMQPDGQVITSSQIGAVAWSGRGGDYLRQVIRRLQYFNFGGLSASIIPINFQVAMLAWSDCLNQSNDPIVQSIEHPELQPTLIDPEMHPSVVETYSVRRYEDVRVRVGSFPDNWFASTATEQSIDTHPAEIAREPNLVSKYRHLRQSQNPISATLGWHIRPSYWDNFYVVNCAGEVYEDAFLELYRPIKRRRVWRR